MEENWVHPFSNNQNVVQPLANPWTRPYLPYATNGVRPDVYVTVHKMINPVAMGRHQEPRDKEPPEVRSWDEGAPPKKEPEPEFKFVKPEEPDEDELKAKKEATAKENKEKAKAEKKEKDEVDAKPDEEASGIAPVAKEPKKPTKEELKKE